MFDLCYNVIDEIYITIINDIVLITTENHVFIGDILNDLLDRKHIDNKLFLHFMKLLN